jgi:hypothetical protein
VSSFEHVHFVINGKYSKNFYDNPDYYASKVVIFQTYKNVVLRNVHSLWWFLRFYPNIIFQNLQLSIFTKPIFKKVFINYTQNKVIHLPNNAIIIKGNYIFLLILNE